LERSTREDGSGEGSDGEHQWKKCRAREEAAPQRRRTASRRCGEEGSRPEADSAAASLRGSEWWRRRRRYACSAEEARLGSVVAAEERPRRKGTERRRRIGMVALLVAVWRWTMRRVLSVTFFHIDAATFSVTCLFISAAPLMSDLRI
jgi:hypothetical protein